MIENIKKDRLLVSALPGGLLDTCIKEAALLCLQEAILVELKHNNRSYYCNPKAITNDIANKKEVNP